MQKFALAAMVVSALALSGCGSSTSAPTTPATPSAALSISSFTATLTSSGSTNVYQVAFQLKETGGKAGATINTIRLSLGNGGSGNADPTAPTKISAGGTLDSGTITLTDSITGQVATQITVTVTFTDDGGHAGTVSSSANVNRPAPPPVTYALTGFVRDQGTGAGVEGATVRVSDGSNAGKSGTTASNGYYAVPGLAAGSFTIHVSAANYNSSDVSVSLTKDTEVDTTLTWSYTCGSSRVPAVVNCINNLGLQPPTAMCQDGAYSCSSGATPQGVCSSHGGPSCYVCPGPWCGQTPR